jgi:hypothetical protein
MEMAGYGASIAEHEYILKDLGDQWDENETVVVRRKETVDRIGINLKLAKEQTALAAQKDNSIKARLRTLADPYKSDPNEMPSAVIARLAELRRQADATSERVASAKATETGWEEKLESAQGLVELGQKGSERILQQIAQIKNKILQMASPD